MTSSLFSNICFILKSNCLLCLFGVFFPLNPVPLTRGHLWVHRCCDCSLWKLLMLACDTCYKHRRNVIIELPKSECQTGWVILPEVACQQTPMIYVRERDISWVGFHSDLSCLVSSLLSSLTCLFNLQMKLEDCVYLEGLGSEYKPVLNFFFQLVFSNNKYRGL